MPRLDLEAQNVETLEVTRQQVRDWFDATADTENKFQEELEDILDTAQGAVESRDVEKVHYVVIKVTTGL